MHKKQTQYEINGHAVTITSIEYADDDEIGKIDGHYTGTDIQFSEDDEEQLRENYWNEICDDFYESTREIPWEAIR